MAIRSGDEKKCLRRIPRDRRPDLPGVEMLIANAARFSAMASSIPIGAPVRRTSVSITVTFYHPLLSREALTSIRLSYVR
jgi:hypothetical protein